MNKETAEFLQHLLDKHKVAKGDFQSWDFHYASAAILKELADALNMTNEEEE